MAAFLGMRGTGDWATNQVPENWAQYILYEYPNGSAPLYAIQSMFREYPVDSHTFHWWTKTLPTQAGSVTSIYIDAGLATEYVKATHSAVFGIVGSVVYAKMAEALAKECRAGHVALLRDASQLTVDVRGIIQDVYYNGASSYVAIKLIEADDNHTTTATYNLSSVDRMLLIGSAFPEGSTAPDAMGYDPVEYENYIQEFRDTYDLTNIAQGTTLRTGDAKKEEKRQCMELHSIGIEKAGFFSQKSSATGLNGKPLRTTQGLIPFIHENASSNVVDFLTDSDFAGQTWLQGGEEFLDKYIAQLFRYLNTGECIAFAGDDALLAINKLAKHYGNIQLTPSDKAYGLAVVTWITPHGKVHFKTHPLFSHETTFQKMAVLLHPKNCRFAPFVGGGINGRTKFETDMQLPGQHSQVDGYYSIGGWKFDFPNQFMVMYNLGADNTA